MRYSIFLFLMFAASCTAVKLAVPSAFSEQATKFHVKGLNGWMINQQLQFGHYSTSSIKRGWDFTSTVQYTKFGINPEEMLLKVFDIDANHRKLNQRNKFRYVIQDGNLSAEVFATEEFSEKQLVYMQRDKNPWFGEASKTQRYKYAFSAAILPFTKEDKDPWSLVIRNKYDAANDTARRLFDRPYVEEEGYATNGKETIQVRPLRIDKVTTKSGKDTKVFGGKILTGYELTWDDGVVAIIDIMDNNIWLANDLDARDKLILSSVASSILLKRMQDVEKDKDDI